MWEWNFNFPSRAGSNDFEVRQRAPHVARRTVRRHLTYFLSVTSIGETSDDVPLVVLRHFRADDALTHLRGEDEATTRWLSGGVSTMESVTRWIQLTQDNWTSGGPRFTFAIETPVGELVGMIEINIDYSHFAGLEPGDANVSYGLYPEYRGRGLASSALLKVRDFMISKGVQRAIIRVEPENVDSVRLAERCGYVPSGVVVNGVGTQYLVFVDDLTRAPDELIGGHL
jgi:RimJ/RimL family protein N-acetyltransferase